MAVYETTLSPTGYKLRLTVNQASQNITNNTSTVTWELRLIQVGGSGRYSGYTHSWSVNIGGQTASGSIGGYDFRAYDELVLGSGSFVIGHNADGTKTISNSGSFSESVANIGSGTASGNLALTTIPRASVPTLSASSFDAGDTVTINTNRASTSFTHTAKYTFGGASGTIATNVGASTTWTPPLSLLSQIPNSVSGTGTITLETYSGGTLIGTKSVTFTLRAPSSVVPDFTTITHSETVSLVSSQVGEYVKTLSKLLLTITGAAGIYGSTIASYKIEVAGQTINASSGTTAAIGQSGTVVITGTVTDSRGRIRVRTVSITVLDYVPPAIDPALTFVRRSNAAGTLQEEGTYLRVDLKAAVQSLLVASVQKNALTYRISSRLRGATTWTVKTTVTPGGVSFNSFVVITSYAVESSWEVLVEVLDKFNTSSAQYTVATSAIFMHWGDGLGLGKFYEPGRGSLDAAGQMYQNNGLAVIDTGDTASLTAPGIVELATTAEAAAGTDTTRAVTPAGLAAGLASNGGMRYVQTVKYTASGTFSKASYPWLKAVRVRVQAAGGAGGGAPANPVNQHSSGGGGGGGGYAEATVLASALAASTTVTIGAPGAAASGAAGGNAAASSFGSHAAASGGGGGGIAATSTLMIGALGGAGGVGTAGDVLTNGQSGGMGSGNATLGHGGLGGASALGGGGRGGYTGAGGGTSGGGDGGDYGGGGGGASSNSSGPAATGGPGGAGIIIVDLYA